MAIIIHTITFQFPERHQASDWPNNLLPLPCTIAAGQRNNFKKEGVSRVQTQYATTPTQEEEVVHVHYAATPTHNEERLQAQYAATSTQEGRVNTKFVATTTQEEGRFQVQYDATPTQEKGSVQNKFAATPTQKGHFTIETLLHSQTKQRNSDF